MKRLLTATCVLLIGFVLGAAFVGTALTVKAGGAPTATRNGDTNGDGELDVSDAVYLLRFLFAGGGNLAEIDCGSTAPRTTLVATNQTRCLGDAGLVDCGIAKARGQDGAYHLGCPLEDRFVDNGDGTVTDNCTGLTWTKGYIDVDGDGEIIPGFSEAKDDLLWADACRFAEDMTYLGHSDWRVPNIHELMSVIDFSSNVGPALFRPYMSVFDFAGSWSSTHEGTVGMACGIHHVGTLGSVVARYDQRLLFAAVRGP